LVEDYRYCAAGPLACPITAFGGLDDRLIGPDRLSAWAAETSAGFELHMLPGGHLFLNPSLPALLALIRERLAP
jgi:medium-chain acyl-[acyl-carrier-protein] hydrolase